ncbi:DUF523 domain-containing protein [Flavobacterium sp.]|uniref:DUF523 domain-containing protein n=1 Tax=Flavobacterium sp. TaxID=239 RepID=UPI002B4B6C15|nr:DUF523 domain-containing protein [Flavobacterium sp.]HLP65723.1 DUF523 domain-containing protein [Flavobacterium sp.]
MTDKEYLRNLRIPTPENPLRVLTSACLIGTQCGANGTSYGEYPSVVKLTHYKNILITPFCPEHFSFGTPREMCDIYGGDGFDVLNGKVKVITESGIDWTDGMIKASEKMLEVARNANIELAVMMDVSAACGSQVIYNGNRFAPTPVHQIGMGVCAAQLTLNGFKVISQRDFESLEILYSKLDANHLINPDAKDHDQNEWVLNYFKK